MKHIVLYIPQQIQNFSFRYVLARNRRKSSLFVLYGLSNQSYHGKGDEIGDKQDQECGEYLKLSAQFGFLVSVVWNQKRKKLISET